MTHHQGKYTSSQLSLETYHNSVEAISKTNLDYIHQSFAHYLENKIQPKSILSGNLPKCLVEGSALHSLVLTPQDFVKDFRVLPALNRRTREGKALYDQIVSQGKPTIPSPVYAKIEAMTRSILIHPSSSVLLQNGEAEVSFIWEDPDTKVLCKCRPDYLQRLIISDIKTCQDASYEAFQRTIIEHRYHVQGAYFIDGISAALKDGINKDFILIAVEKTPPFAVAVYKLDEELIELGRDTYKKDLQKYKNHINNPNLFQGYNAMIQSMAAPGWIKKRTPEIKSVTTEVLV
jgi:hypothetical protein